jgi:multiple sugar transport system ATP-binding protein
LARASKAERKARADEAARILQMEHLMDRKPSQLSGGQRQRVAIGNLHKQLQATMIYVTHHQIEAMTLADKTVVLRDGRAIVGSAVLKPVEVPLNVPSQRQQLVTGASAKLAIRPQYLGQAAEGRSLLGGRVEIIERLGTETVVNLKIGPTERVLMSISQDLAFDIGQEVGVSFDPEKAHLFAS